MGLWFELEGGWGEMRRAGRTRSAVQVSKSKGVNGAALGSAFEARADE